MSSPNLYPLYLDLKGQTCLVIGGGAVAERKVAGLVEAGARVHVVSPAITLTLQEQAEAGIITVDLVAYDARHAALLRQARLAFAATDNREVNARVAKDAKLADCRVNVADAPDEGDFITPSVVRRGALCLAISTGGANPMLSARLSQELEARFGPEYGDFVELLGRMRLYIKQQPADSEMRRFAQERLFADEETLRALLRAGQGEAARARAEASVNDLLRLFASGASEDPAENPSDET